MKKDEWHWIQQCGGLLAFSGGVSTSSIEEFNHKRKTEKGGDY